jgi:hypothetical protein
MDAETAARKARFAFSHVIALLLLIVVTQGPMLLMDGTYFDGRALLNHLGQKNWPVLQTWFGEAGLMGFYEIYRAVGSFPNIVLAYRLTAFLALGLSALLVYLICYRSRLLSRSESFFVALVQLTFPAFRSNFSLIVLPFLLGYASFLLGAYLAIRSYDARGWIRHASRLMSLVLLFLSYTTNSVLVLHYGFLLFMLLMVRRREQLTVSALVRRYALRFADFAVLPIVYWIVKEVLFPRHGVYENYNQFVFAPKEIALGLMRFFANSVVIQTNETLITLLALPVIWLLVMAVTVFALARTRFRDTVTFDSPTPSWGMILFGAVLLLLAMVPYVLVQKTPGVYGFGTRFAIFISLGVGVVVVGTVKAVFGAAGGRITQTGVVVLVTLVLAFSLSRMQTIFHWQARWIKDRSIELHLREMPPCPASTYFIDEEFPLADEVASQSYFSYDWSTLFETAWGDESRVGLALGTDVDEWWARDSAYPQFARIRNLADYDPKGGRARLIIRPGANAGGPDMVLWYWWFQYLGRRGPEDFLRGVTTVAIEMEPEPPTGP